MTVVTTGWFRCFNNLHSECTCFSYTRNIVLWMCGVFSQTDVYSKQFILVVDNVYINFALLFICF